MAINLRDTSVFIAERVPMTANVRDVSVYVMEQDPPQPTVRAVRGAVLADDPRGAVVRAARAALLASLRAPDFTKDGLTAMLAAINAEWNLSLTSALVSIENPRALAGDAMFDTLIDVRALQGSKLTGTMTLRYRRYAMADAFVGKDPAAFPVPEATTIHAVLPRVNSFYNLALTTADVRNGGVAANGLVVLQAVSTSMRFLPNSLIRLGTTVKDLNGSIAVGDLTGFTAA